MVGTYLFLGGSRREEWVRKNPVAKFVIVEAWMSGNGVLTFVGDGLFFYPEEMMGVFRPFDEPYPQSWGV